MPDSVLVDGRKEIDTVLQKNNENIKIQLPLPDCSMLKDHMTAHEHSALEGGLRGLEAVSFWEPGLNYPLNR